MALRATALVSALGCVACPPGRGEGPSTPLPTGAAPTMGAASTPPAPSIIAPPVGAPSASSFASTELAASAAPKGPCDGGAESAPGPWLAFATIGEHDDEAVAQPECQKDEDCRWEPCGCGCQLWHRPAAPGVGGVGGPACGPANGCSGGGPCVPPVLGGPIAAHRLGGCCSGYHAFCLRGACRGALPTRLAARARVMCGDTSLDAATVKRWVGSLAPLRAACGDALATRLDAGGTARARLRFAADGSAAVAGVGMLETPRSTLVDPAVWLDAVRERLARTHQPGAPVVWLLDVELDCGLSPR